MCIIVYTPERDNPKPERIALYRSDKLIHSSAGIGHTQLCFWHLNWSDCVSMSTPLRLAAVKANKTANGRRKEKNVHLCWFIFNELSAKTERYRMRKKEPGHLGATCYATLRSRSYGCVLFNALDKWHIRQLNTISSEYLMYLLTKWFALYVPNMDYILCLAESTAPFSSHFFFFHLREVVCPAIHITHK